MVFCIVRLECWSAGFESFETPEHEGGRRKEEGGRRKEEGRRVN